MPRNSIQDIKPTNRKLARDKGEVIPVHVEQERPAPVRSAPREVPFEPAQPKHSSRYALWYIAGACVIGFFLSLSFLFQHATVTITPKSLPLSFDSTDTFTAQKDSTADGAIVYTVMSLKGDESIKLPGTQSKTQSSFATGTVILYNAYQAAPYKLVKSTRLATSDGRIYRIDSAVSIPGYTKTNGTIVPGSVSVTVTAAAAGEASNIVINDFTLPGLAGTPQAAKIYGRTKTQISGGISGTVYTIPQDAANAALGTLRDKLKASLIAKAKVQVPDGYLYYDGAVVFTTDSSVQAPYSKTSDVPLALSGTLTVYLIKQDALVGAIAQKSITQYNGEPVTIPKLYALSLVPSGTITPATDTSFTFSLSGSADIIWTIKPDDIKPLLAGKKKSEFQGILTDITGIDRADLVIKPFWKQKFPEDISRITVVVK